VQCDAKPVGGKFNKVPDLLRHETAGGIDDANGNRIGLELGKDAYERSNCKMRGGLIGIEPRHTVARDGRFDRGLIGIDSDSWGNGHFLLLLAR